MDFRDYFKTSAYLITTTPTNNIEFSRTPTELTSRYYESYRGEDMPYKYQLGISTIFVSDRGMAQVTSREIGMI